MNKLNFYSHKNLENIKHKIANGAILSTNLSFDEEQKTKLIGLSILTLGIYGIVHLYQLKPERVYSKMREDLNRLQIETQSELDKIIESRPFSPAKLEELEKAKQLLTSDSGNEISLFIFSSPSISEIYKAVQKEKIIQAVKEIKEAYLKLDPKDLDDKERPTYLLISEAKFEYKIGKDNVLITWSKKIYEEKSLFNKFCDIAFHDDDLPAAPPKSKTITTTKTISIPSVSVEEILNKIDKQLELKEKLDLCIKKEKEIKSDFETLVNDISSLMVLLKINRQIDEAKGLSAIKNQIKQYRID